METRKVFDRNTGKIIDEVEINLIFNNPAMGKFFLSIASDEELDSMLGTQIGAQNYEAAHLITTEVKFRKSKSQ